MAFSLSNKCARNFGKQTILVQFIIEKVITCFCFGGGTVYKSEVEVLGD